MRRVTILLISLLVAVTACDDGQGQQIQSDTAYDLADMPDGGDDASNDVDRFADSIDVPPPVCLDGRSETEPTIVGQVYSDNDGSDQSVYVQHFDRGVDTPLTGVDVALLGGDDERSGVTCDDGTFVFGGVSDGVYLVDVELDGSVATTRNQSVRLPEAIREGSANILTFGDSLPVLGAEVRFPTRLATLLSELATIENVNVAVAGTTSEQWMPGENLFEANLRPRIADADVVIISLGGNDVLYYMEEAYEDPSLAAERLDELDEFILEVIDRMLTIADEIRATNADVDIVYGLYPNYATSDIWIDLAGSFAFILEAKFAQVLNLVRKVLDPAEEIILVDLFGATQDLDLDDYLYDQIHLNHAGHQLYAEEILRALGGARVGADPIGLDHNLGLMTLEQ